MTLLIENEKETLPSSSDLSGYNCLLSLDKLPANQTTLGVKSWCKKCYHFVKLGSTYTLHGFTYTCQTATILCSLKRMANIRMTFSNRGLSSIYTTGKMANCDGKS